MKTVSYNIECERWRLFTYSIEKTTTPRTCHTTSSKVERCALLPVTEMRVIGAGSRPSRPIIPRPSRPRSKSVVPVHSRVPAQSRVASPVSIVNGTPVPGRDGAGASSCGGPHPPAQTANDSEKFSRHHVGS